MAEHGHSGYVRGCRCDVCRDAKADYMRRYRHRQDVPAAERDWGKHPFDLEAGMRARHDALFGIGQGWGP